MISIHLDNCTFYSYHGIHPEESVTGGTFVVNAKIDFQELKRITSLDETVNYADLYEIIKAHMHKPYPLLETLAMDIADAMYNADKKIQKINITIHKMNPPIVNFIGNLGISFSKEFN